MIETLWTLNGDKDAVADGEVRAGEEAMEATRDHSLGAVTALAVSAAAKNFYQKFNYVFFYLLLDGIYATQWTVFFLLFMSFIIKNRAFTVLIKFLEKVLPSCQYMNCTDIID
jgi:hypothetical protein